MRAEDILNALPIPFYVIDLKKKVIVQTNDPNVLVEDKACFLQIFNRKEPCKQENETCICSLTKVNSEIQFLVESGEKGGRRFYKVDAKKTGKNNAVATFTDITLEKNSEREIKINNFRLRRAENLASFGSWEIDLKNNRVSITDGAQKILGLSMPELLFDEIKKIVLPEYWAYIDMELEALVTGKKPYNVHFKIKRLNDGEIRYIHSIAEFREDKKMVFGVIHDITERTSFESALHESHNDLRMAQKIARIGNWKFDPDTRSLTTSEQVNQIFEGHQLPRYPGKLDFEKLISDQQFDLIEKNFLQAVKFGKSFKNQIRINLTDNSPKWIEIICLPDREKSDAGYFLRGTVQDISGTKKVEKELQHSNTMFRTLIQNLPDAVYMKDTACRKLIANEEDARRCSMQKIEQVIGKTDFDIYPEEVARRYYEDDLQVINQGKIILNREEELPGNPKRWILTTKVPLKDKHGRITGLVGIGHDITHRKKMVEDLNAARLKAEESDRLKSVFLANMSHEIRTPLNGILGFSSFISSGNSDPKQLEFYDKIIQSCGERLTSVIDNIFDISLIQSNQLKLSYSSFSINDVLEELYDLYNDQKIEQLNYIDFKIKNLSVNESVVLYSDKIRIIQIFKNLLDNAFKFTQTGFIEFGCFYSEKGELTLFVEDSGIGIEADKQSIIFENFRQAEEGFTRQYEGAGLGLPIVAGLVKSLGGKIEVKSNPKSGSAFYITLPDGLSKNEGKRKTNDNTVKGIKIPEKLIVSFEDDPASAEYLKSVAKLMGCKLMNFENPVTGIEYLRNNKADLILMDVRLPLMTGFQATQIIKSEFPNLPVIIQTAYALKEDREKAFNAGCDDYLAKPVPLKDLKEKIRHYVGEFNLQVLQ